MKRILTAQISGHRSGFTFRPPSPQPPQPPIPPSITYVYVIDVGNFSLPAKLSRMPFFFILKKKVLLIFFLG